mgnify:CR=1 FL=1
MMPGFWEAFADTWGFIGAVAGFLLPFIIVAAVCGGAAIAWGEIWRHIKHHRPHP